MTIWLTILGMALATYATRVTTMLALRGDVAPWLRRWLGYVPVAVFTALILPPLLLQTQGGAKALAFGPARLGRWSPGAPATCCSRSSRGWRRSGCCAGWGCEQSAVCSRQSTASFEEINA